jgi:hypothetical protein
VTFTLRGHDCPAGRYPAPVVPIGERNGTLYAVFRNPDADNTVSFEQLREDTLFVRHSDSLSEDLRRSFDPSSSELFALSETDVRCYSFEHQLEFFRSLLSGPEATRFGGDFRVSHCIRTGEERLYLNEFLRKLCTSPEHSLGG